VRLGCVDGDYRLVCECGLGQCAQAIVVPSGIFAELRRSDEPRALVAAGHGSPFTDCTVATTASYDVVAPKTAERLDPSVPTRDALPAA
jgi:hypothetical protein